MRISTHLMAGAAFGIAFAPNIFSFVAAVAGSIVPDKLDSWQAGGDYDKWSKIHRGWTHNVFWWALLAVCLDLFLVLPKGYGFKIISQICWFFLGGCATHLALDFLNPTGVGVCPFMSVRSRIGLGIIKTNSVCDTLTGIVLLLGAIAWRYHKGFSVSSFFPM